MVLKRADWNLWIVCLCIVCFQGKTSKSADAGNQSRTSNAGRTQQAIQHLWEKMWKPQVVSNVGWPLESNKRVQIVNMSDPLVVDAHNHPAHGDGLYIYFIVNDGKGERTVELPSSLIHCTCKSYTKDGWVELLEVTVGSTSVKVARGQTAVLPCTFKTSAALNQLNVIWTVTPQSNANQPEQVILYQGGQVISGASHFNSRVGFVITMPSLSASIFINNSQLSDTGTYQCLVNNPPDRGERNIGVLGLSVLVPPAIPLCQLQGAVATGNDVTLTCSSEEGLPLPTYSWEKLDSTAKLPPTSVEDKMQGTLILRNISTAINGLYQCTVANIMGSHNCAIDLQVIESQIQHVGIIAGAVITGIVVLLLGIVFVIIILFYRRSKNKYEEEEIPNEIREDAIPPSSSIKGFHPDGSSENDTLASANTYSAHYWQRKNPTYESHMFNRYNGHMHHSINMSSNHPLYMNGSHHTIPKTAVITTSSSPSSQNLARYNDSLGRKTPPPLPHSYTVSHANLQRMGGIPVMIPAQNRVGSLV